VGAVDAPAKSAEGSSRDPRLEASISKLGQATVPPTVTAVPIRTPEGTGRAPASEYFDGQPRLSGRIAEADSAQPTRNTPCLGGCQWAY
jgi:hypothetical protein